MTSPFDEDGLLRDSYNIARTTLVNCGLTARELATIEGIAAAFTLYFFASNVLYSDRGESVTKREDIEQYACLPVVSTALRLFFPTRITRIVCTDAHLTCLPASICGLKRIRTINVRGNDLKSLPDDLYKLRNLEMLDVSFNAITKLPELRKSTNLRTLNAMNNRIREVPVMPPSLIILGLKGNEIERIAEDVFDLATEIEQLYLTSNLLTSLPASISKLHKLRKLQASHNRLTSVPAGLAELPHLEMLRLAVNELESLPDSLLRSPALSWLSLQGNPMTNSKLRLVTNSTKVIDEQDLAVGRLLGAGASGEVHEATYRRCRVAYKIFVDNKSPDGDWQDEIKLACMFSHECLAKVIARVRDDRKEIRGFIMEYREGIQLADRPTQTQLLRCRWAHGRVFDVRFVINCLLSICSSLEHLHSRCVAHGDLYAHNVLARSDGTSMLCDYGAAFVYPKGNTLFEKHEVRAFGLLVRDLIERVDISFADMNAALYCQKQLLVMAQRCLSVDVDARPRFSDMGATIKKLHKTLSK